MTTQTENGMCNKHSGVCAEIEHLMESDRDQWASIKAMNRTLTSTLTAVIITLLVALLNLGIMLVKYH